MCEAGPGGQTIAVPTQRDPGEHCAGGGIIMVLVSLKPVGTQIIEALGRSLRSEEKS